jgi:hypothetical protein
MGQALRRIKTSVELSGKGAKPPYFAPLAAAERTQQGDLA